MFNKKNHLLIFFNIIAFIGIFLTKMDHPPFTHLYEWLYLNMPGFDFFRESSKFISRASLLAYSSLSAGGITFPFYLFPYRISKTLSYYFFVFCIFLRLLMFSSTFLNLSSTLKLMSYVYWRFRREL